MKNFTMPLIVCVCIIMLATFSFAGNGRGMGNRRGMGNGSGHRNYQQNMNGNGNNRNWNNGNENTNTGMGRNFVDNNGDGINDNCKMAKANKCKYQGAGNMQQTGRRVGPRDGSGPQRSRDGSNCGNAVNNQ